MNVLLEKREKLIFSLAILLSILGAFCLDSLLPSFPAMTQAFHSNAQMIKLSISLYLFGFSISQLAYGPLSDQFGRKPIILFGLFVSVFGNLVCLFVTSIHFFLMGRAIQGLGLGVTNALYRALFRDTFTDVKMAKMVSYGSMAYSVSTAFAPVMGGYAQHNLGWYANLSLQFIILLTVVIILAVYLPETLPKTKRISWTFQAIIKKYLKLLFHPTFICFTLISSLANAGLIAYLTESPFLYECVLKLNPIAFGWLNVILTAALFFGGWFNAFILNYMHYQKAIKLGNFIMLLCGLFMLLLNFMHLFNVNLLLWPSVVFIFGSGFVFANAMTCALNPFAEIAGLAGGLYGSIQVFTGFAASASVIVAHIHSVDQRPLAIIFIAIAVISFILQNLKKV